MVTINDIRDRYDRFSAYYVLFWGNHIHHGYWNDEREGAGRAQENLVHELARRAMAASSLLRKVADSFSEFLDGLRTIDEAFRKGKMAYVLFAGSR